ncbi:MAG: Gfo/Idh/MocA family oxidoreductase [Oscillospiraceae bacterium]|nr:Gfo/Idh/MocA family oxidoreductase [Oscillospiraceae bacterium]
MKKVITYGTFDLFHEGHYRLLKRAKELGDYLIVGVTSEEFDRSRGKLNVIDSLVTRIENVKNTGFADEIIVEEVQGQKFRDIKKYDIDIFTVGSDWVGHFDYLKDYCEVVYLERTKEISSTQLRNRANPILRMGIIGTGRIASRFIPESHLVSGISVTSVYNPNKASADKFAKRWDLNSFGGTEAFSDFLEYVDCVYIATPHEHHYDYALRAMEAGKHVLCEKPFTLRAAETEALYTYAEEHGLVIMEGIKTAYCPGFNKLISIACSGKIGAVRNIEACFTKLENSLSRELTDTKYGGSFTELASYTLLPIIKLFGVDYEEVRFDSIKDKNGIDLFTKAHFRYPNGMATATCGLGVKSEGQLIISGTKGYILAESPWWKTSYFEVRYEDPNNIEKYSDVFLNYGLRYEISDFVSTINGNKTNDFKLIKEESIAISGIIEDFLSMNR